MSGPAAVDEALEPRRPGLLSFYDRLRARIAAAAAERGGKRGEGVAEALLLVPDVFMLLARLALDPEVPAASRRLIGGALLYFVVPLDLLPEAFAGPVGYLDDLVIACAVLGEAFGQGLEPWAARYWSGSRRLAHVLTDVARTADTLLSADLAARVRKLLARRGVELPARIRAANGGEEAG